MIYEINKNLKNNYQKLINLAQEYCNYFSLIVEGEDVFPINLYDKLTPFLFRLRSTNKWPGTILFNSMAKQYIFQLNNEIISAISYLSLSLFLYILLFLII